MRRPLAALLAIGLATAGALAVASPASAASETVTSGSASWGVKASFRSYVVNGPAAGQITLSGGATQAAGNGVFAFVGGTGTADTATGTADIDFTGSVRFYGHSGALDLTFSNPRLVATAGGAGTVYVDFTGTSFTGGTPISGTNVALASLSGVTLTQTGSTVAITSGAATLASTGVEAFGGFYAAGDALDPISATAAVVVPAVATTTALAVSPTSPQVAGTPVTLTATVAPAAVGSVQFLVDGTPFQPAVAVAAGSASLPNVALAAGAHSLSAQFLPADSALFTGSTSAATPYEITAVPDAVTPTLTKVIATAPQPVAGDPATTSPVRVGTVVTMTTTVSSQAPGTVQFLDAGVPVGGAVAVVAGSATQTASSLAAGEHTITATFAPANPALFNAASTPSALSYRAAPGAAPADCVLNEAAAIGVSGISASWAVNGYTSTWTHTTQANSDIAVDGSTFVFSGGEGRSDGTCTVLDFDGSFSLTNTAGGGAIFHFDSPTITVAANGSGSLTADVTTTPPSFNPSAPAPDPVGPTRAAVAEFTGADSAADGRNVEFSVTPLYQGAVPIGSWATGFDSAFPGSLLFAVPSSVRAYFAQTSSSGANLTKPPTPLSVDYELDALPTATTLSVTPVNPVLIGAAVTLTAHVTSAFGQPDGNVEFYENDELIDTVAVTAGVAVLAAPTQTAGSAAITAMYLPGTESDFRESASAPYQLVIVDEPVVVYTPTVAPSLGSLEPGQTITFTGTGFAPNEPVSGVVNSDPVSLGSARASASGTVVFTWTVPANFSVGAHSIVLTGANSGSAASATFEVIAPPVACVARTISGATLSWGIKSSFVSYISGPIAAGSYSTSGVTGQFTWSGGTGTANPSSALALASYYGSVSFTGHGGLLALTVANPTIQITGPTSALLLLDVTSKSLDSGVTTSKYGVAFATLSLGGGSNNSTADRIAYAGAPATLTAGGATMFAGFYNAGAALDAVSFVLPLGAEAPCTAAVDPTSSASLASTGASVSTQGVLAVLVLSLGAGLLMIARRRTDTI